MCKSGSGTKDKRGGVGGTFYMPLLTQIQHEVWCWRAIAANMVFSYHFSLFSGKVVSATVKVLSKESPFAIMLKT
jgi:hypothetical protein